MSISVKSYQNFHFRVSLHNVIKVADFGLSVTIGEDKDYFRISDSSNEKLPVKWMAVETLIDHKFSEASDVVRSLYCLLFTKIKYSMYSPHKFGWLSPKFLKYKENIVKSGYYKYPQFFFKSVYICRCRIYPLIF